MARKIQKTVSDLLKEKELLDAQLAAATVREQALNDCFNQIDQFVVKGVFLVDDIVHHYLPKCKYAKARVTQGSTQKADKFCNPDNITQVWCGVGKSIPWWFKLNIKNGMAPWDMLIDKTGDSVAKCKAWFDNPKTQERLSS